MTRTMNVYRMEQTANRCRTVHSVKNSCGIIGMIFIDAYSDGHKKVMFTIPGLIPMYVCNRLQTAYKAIVTYNLTGIL